MPPIEITSSAFRQNMKKYMDVASTGRPVFVYRGAELYSLQRVQPSRYLDDDTLAAIRQAREEISRGEGVKVSTKEELDSLLESL